MEDIRKRIDQGETPATIAKEEGGLAKGAVGMDMGWTNVNLRTLPLEVQKATAKLKAGETSRVVLSEDSGGRPKAMHIIKLLDRQPAMGKDFESAKPILLENLRFLLSQRLAKEASRSGDHRVILNLSGIKPHILKQSKSKKR